MIRIVFKGCDNEEAVLCSATNTYRVREVETTNLVMLVEDPSLPDSAASQDNGTGGGDADPSTSYMGRATQQALLDEGSRNHEPVTVTALVNAHLELTRMKPKLHTLDRLLKETHVIRDVTSEDGSESQIPAGVEWETCVDTVQASPQEISQALQEIDAVRIRGKWMGISQEAFSVFVKIVLLTITEHGWTLDKVPNIPLAEELEKNGVCGQLTLQLLHRISAGQVTDVVGMIEELDRDDWREREAVHYSLDVRHICRHMAIGILLEQQHWDNLDDFMAAWKSVLPEDIEPASDMLRGECLVVLVPPRKDVIGEQHAQFSIQKLSETELPRDPEDRFEQLFQIQKEWTFDQVQPYIHNLIDEGQTEEELLLQYARPSQTRPEDETTYTAR